MTYQKQPIIVLAFCSSILFISTSFAQILTSGFYPNKGQLTIAPSYTYKTSDNFFRGKTLTDGNPAGLGDISSNIINLYAEYGITDKISVDVNLPYISNESETGELDPVLNDNEVSGVQDLNLFFKYKILENHSDLGCLKLGAAAGIGFPLSDYEGGGVISIGNEATSYNFDAIFQYELPINVFVELQGGYSNRDSDDFDVPNAITYAIKVGYFTEHFYLHAELDIQDSTGGTDIGGEGFGGPATLPETEVDYSRLNFSVYLPLYKDIIGLSTGYSNTIAGRNFSKESSVSVGLVYKN